MAPSSISNSEAHAGDRGEVTAPATAPGEHHLPLEIRPVDLADSGEILALQHAAYVTQAQLYGDPNLPPLTQTHEHLLDELRHSLALKAVHGQRIVGAVRARIDPPRMHVGRLVVAPDVQGRGIGTALLAAIEGGAPETVWVAALFTGKHSTANLRLYQRAGYREVRRERPEHGPQLVHLEKALRPQPITA